VHGRVQRAIAQQIRSATFARSARRNCALALRASLDLFRRRAIGVTIFEVTRSSRSTIG
jgi:hypothetical protein